MKFFTAILAASIAASALAEDIPGTVVAGKRYATGFLHREGPSTAPHEVPQVADAPESYDARDEGFVTAIKNQGNCGSCWAFGRTKAFEAALIKAGTVDFSLNLGEQDPLVNDRSAYGCSGGFLDATFEVSKGTTTEALCPYRASGRTACRGTKFAKAARWAMVGQRGRAPTVDELKAAIYKYGVLAVTVAAGSGFSPGRDGRITSCGSRQVNHIVTLVGYRPAPTGGGTEFLIANSWGTGWGPLGGFAWSKQGCNRLASTPGDAALFITMEP